MMTMRRSDLIQFLCGSNPDGHRLQEPCHLTLPSPCLHMLAQGIQCVAYSPLGGQSQCVANDLIVDPEVVKVRECASERGREREVKNGVKSGGVVGSIRLKFPLRWVLSRESPVCQPAI